MAPVTRVLFAVFLAVPMVQAAVPMAPTTTILCPAGSALFMVVSAPNVPPGWSATSLGQLVLVKATIGVFGVRQELSCQYNATGFGASCPATFLRTYVPLEACVVTDGRAFTCKAGTMPGAK